MKSLLLFIISSLFVLTVLAQSGQPVVLVMGKVLNDRNMQAIGAKVIYEDLSTGEDAGIARSDPADGSYKIILPRGKKYGYYALAEGFYSVTKNLDVSNLDKYTEVEDQNLYLAPVELDQVVRLNNVFFAKGSASITEESEPELQRLVQFLKINKKIEIEISAHTDNSLSSDKSKKLTEDRAKSIMEYLTSNGIKERRLTAKGYGSDVPLGFNNSEEGRALNNRLEFKVLSLEKTKK
ncbi:MAG: hypothetical protein C0594_13950 [Marinilabiliales bacterium]|nr:MAG: hypothetical protein C0594_13950 [Marinilabiliales bacterium]